MFSRRSAPQHNRGRIATAASGSDDTPLGRGFWSLYVDVRDYESSFTSGDTVSANQTPRVGSSTVNPVNSPTVATGALGIGQRMVFKHVAASNMSFTAHWVAPIMNGVKKAGTIAVRMQRGAAAAAIWAGFGKAASGTNSYFEIAIAAAGQAILRKNDGTTTATRVGTTVLGSTSHSVIITTSADGNTGYLYVDGVLESTPLDMSGLTNSIVIDQFRIGNSGRLTGGGGLDGIWQVCAVSANTISAAQALTIHNAWVAQDTPAVAGAKLYFVGDSLTKNAFNFRLATYDWKIANSKNLDMVGAFSDGSFPDNQHSGANGVEIASIRGRALAELGPTGAYPGVKFVHVLGCVNDLNNIGANVATILSDYATALEDIFTLAASSDATVRLGVSTIMPLQPGTQGEAEVVSWNAGVVAVWDAFDVLHPGNTLIRWDLYTAIGGAWNALYYSDSTHPNADGWAVACAHPSAGFTQAVSAYFTSIG